MIRLKLISWMLILAGAFVSGGSLLATGLATDITGLYYTGLDSSGNLQTGGLQDANWNVTYAYYNHQAYSGTSQYTGAAYTVLGSALTSADYADNTASAQWITAPGATDSLGGSVNTGELYLPGNGTSTDRVPKSSSYYKEGIFVYTLEFTITGTGSGTVTNDISIGMTIAADDGFKIYVNPAGNGTTLPTGTDASGGIYTQGQWTGTTTVTLQNGTDDTGTSGNSVFKIGTNYIVIVVDNTNSATGPSTSTDLNASGLLVYQLGSAVTIDGRVIPEVGTWMPLVAALLLYGLLMWHRSRRASMAARGMN
ncbi:MAG: hypothetical protein WC205_01955 [Opitutaceae bacterium]